MPGTGGDCSQASAVAVGRQVSALQESKIDQPKPTVLCVDDQADMLSLMRLVLSMEEFDVITASSAMEALHCIEQRVPDLVLTDYVMPGMNGLDLCRELRERAETGHVRIILHSGSDIAAECRALYDLFIPKSTDLYAVSRALRRILRQPWDESASAPDAVS